MWILRTIIYELKRRRRDFQVLEAKNFEHEKQSTKLLNDSSGLRNFHNFIFTEIFVQKIVPRHQIVAEELGAGLSETSISLAKPLRLYQSVFIIIAMIKLHFLCMNMILFQPMHSDYTHSRPISQLPGCIMEPSASHLLGVHDEVHEMINLFHLTQSPKNSVTVVMSHEVNNKTLTSTFLGGVHVWEIHL